LIASRSQREDLGMGLAGALVPCLTNTNAIANQNTTHARVGVSRVLTALRQS
jgi:hypothetical protein